MVTGHRFLTWLGPLGRSLGNTQLLAYHWPWVLISLLLLNLLVFFLCYGQLGAWLNFSQDSYSWQALGLTLYTSLATVFLALILGSFLAALLQSISWRGYIYFFSGLSFVLPPVVVVLGLLEWLGPEAFFGQWLVAGDFFSPLGLVLAFLYYNLAYAVVYFSLLFDQLPGENHLMAQSFGLNFLARFRFLYLPLIRAYWPGLFLLVCLFCWQDFALAYLVLSDPGEVNLSLATYQSLFYDFEWNKATWFGLLQLVGGALLVLLTLLGKKINIYQTFSAPVKPRCRKYTLHWLEFFPLAIFCFFVSLPYSAALQPLFSFQPTTWKQAQLLFSSREFYSSLLYSLLTASLAALLALSLAYCHLCHFVSLLPKTRNHQPKGKKWQLLFWWFFPLGLLLVPGFLLGISLFASLQLVPLEVGFLYPVFMVLLQSIASFPLLVFFWRDAFVINRLNSLPIGQSLGIKGWAKFRFIDWPALKTYFLLGLGIAFAFALGDIGAALLFGREYTTLSLLQSYLIHSYRFEQAGFVQLVLLGLILLGFLPVRKLTASSGFTFVFKTKCC